MPEQQTKPKKLTMVQQSIIDARNAPALTPEMQAALDALVSAPMTGGEVNQCHRVRQRAHPQDHQDTRPLPQRRGGDQADLAGTEKYHEEVGEARVSLESRHGAIRHPVRRPLYETRGVKSDCKQ